MILVTGGAGYIGSHVVKDLLDLHYQVIVIDNLSNGNKQAIDHRAIFIPGDICDKKLLETIFTSYQINGVIHFAAFAYVGESVKEPLKYYKNNVGCTLALLEMMVKHKVKNIVFSSTCAVYGEANSELLNENSPLNPINPYGISKLMNEQIIQDLSNVNSLEFIILRYFNVAGADIKGGIGEVHAPETHLIPNILNHLLGKSDHITIYGNDYNTPDGTCIRDYIHVSDLSSAHILALESLLTNKLKNRIYNIGTETGHSVEEIIAVCEKITGKKAVKKYASRRKGDPDKLVASSQKIQNELKWKPKYTIDDSVSTAWDWISKHPNGYH